MRFLDHTQDDLHLNLALEEALLEEVEAGGTPLLRVWEQREPSVILGASGRIGDDLFREAIAADRVTVARRSSGGGTVVIGPGALNFTVILPIAEAPEYAAVDLAQKAVLARSAEGLNRFNPPDRPRIEVLGSGDLTIARMKCSGSAQRRVRHHFLVHASLLYAFPLDLISRYLRPPGKQPDYREGRPHESFVANLGLSRASLVEGLRWAWNAWETEEDLRMETLKSARDLVEAKFGRPDWIERL